MHFILRFFFGLLSCFGFWTAFIDSVASMALFHSFESSLTRHARKHLSRSRSTTFSSSSRSVELRIPQIIRSRISESWSVPKLHVAANNFKFRHKFLYRFAFFLNSRKEFISLYGFILFRTAMFLKSIHNILQCSFISGLLKVQSFVYLATLAPNNVKEHLYLYFLVPSFHTLRAEATFSRYELACEK